MKAHLIANSRSGKGAGGTLPEVAHKICQENNVELVHHEVREGVDMDQLAAEAVDAASEDGGIVIAAGGDGTIRCVAQKAAGRTVKFAVVPCGTFNFFARTHRVPENVEEAFRLAVTGETRAVRLGEVNGHIFLINASLGLYAKAIREREQRTSHWGRNRFVVIISTILSLLSRHHLLNVEMTTGDRKLTLRTPMIFIGNNSLQLRDLQMSIAKCMKLDLLAVVLMKPLSKLETLRVIFRGIFKTIEKEERLDSFCVESLTIHTRKSHQMVALDGEIFTMTSPLKVHALPKILNMVLPPKIETP